ncbi:unnamed protein product [Phyllotreta striolata]|uniref:Uncharacterized protein n=1 Tax=Phyllotreta striolata TaxID=444603 RepID=A0A9P0DX83_PHYSR|nr:unnamed protein product [Phyllotreta striolata]
MDTTRSPDANDEERNEAASDEDNKDNNANTSELVIFVDRPINVKNKDRSDSLRNNSLKLPHYLPMTNLTETTKHYIIIDEKGKGREHQQQQHQKGRRDGADNPAFVDDDDRPREAAGGGHAEAANLELINLKPEHHLNGGRSSSETTNTSSNSTGIPAKGDEEAAKSRYDEYFVPVNEYRKCMRGEKLYLTKDNRVKKNKRKLICWILLTCITAVVIVLIVLATGGTLGNSRPQPVEATGRNLDGGTVIKAGISAPEFTVIDHSPSSMNSSGKPPDEPTTTEVYVPTVPNAADVEFAIENMFFSEALKEPGSTEFKTLASSLEKLLKNNAIGDILHEKEADDVFPELRIRILEFSPGSIVAAFRMGWTNNNTIDMEIDTKAIRNDFNEFFERQSGFLGPYRVKQYSLKVRAIRDLCQITQPFCNSICRFDYNVLNFTCSCPPQVPAPENMTNCLVTNADDKDDPWLSEESDFSSEQEYKYDYNDRSSELLTLENKDSSTRKPPSEATTTTTTTTSGEFIAHSNTTGSATRSSTTITTSTTTTTSAYVIPNVLSTEEAATQRVESFNFPVHLQNARDYDSQTSSEEELASDQDKIGESDSDSSEIEESMVRGQEPYPLDRENLEKKERKSFILISSGSGADNKMRNERTDNVTFEKSQLVMRAHSPNGEDVSKQDFYVDMSEDVLGQQDKGNSKETSYDIGVVYTPEAEVLTEPQMSTTESAFLKVRVHKKKHPLREPKIQELHYTNEEMEPSSDFVESQSQEDYMSPFLPEIDNDTFVNSLGPEDHSHDNATSIKPPTLEFDQINRTNPFDTSNVEDSTQVDIKPQVDVIISDGTVNSTEESTTITESTTLETTTTEDLDGNSTPDSPTTTDSTTELSTTFVPTETTTTEIIANTTTIDTTTESETTTVTETTTITETTTSTETTTATETTTSTESTTTTTEDTTDRNSTSLFNFKEISTSTEDLIALETTTNDLIDSKTNKSDLSVVPLGDSTTQDSNEIDNEILFDESTTKSTGNQSCPLGHFECSGGTCVPGTWRCDGTKDCDGGEDEEATICSCTEGEFKCKIGGGCVPETNVCDGTAQCADESDEWNCLKLDHLIDENKKILQVSDGNGTWYPICMDWTSWNTAVADRVCQKVGYTASSALESVPNTGNTSTTFTYVLKYPSNDSILRFEGNKLPDCDQYVSISCQEYVCGSTSSLEVPAARIVGGEKASPAQFSSVALLFDKKNKIYCTATLVTPLWALSSYSCLAQTPQIAADDWYLYAGGTPDGDNSTTQIRQLERIVTHPQSKLSSTGFSNDVVLLRLENPVNLNVNVSAICLPTRPVQPRQLCIVAGWGLTEKSAESDQHRYLHYLPVPLMDLDECNSTKYYDGKLAGGKICAGYTDSDKTPCFKDEGAPLLCYSEKASTWELYGVLSHHGGCGSTGLPALYEAVDEQTRTWTSNTVGAAAV